MVYLLVLVILGGGNAGNQSLRVGHFRSLESCQAAANEAKAVGLDRGNFGFVCVRSFGPSELASEQPRRGVILRNLGNADVAAQGVD
jgi:hypothetical protein